VDQSGHYTICNARAASLLELPETLIARRPHASEVLDYMRGRGEFEKTTSDDCVRSMREMHKASIYERVRPNGVVLEVRTVPTDDGGAV
ncbi:PAS-domain containing protein, partial [Salmonella enterica]|uniref:PAS-domain containing protein n=1 Tax=Salmonella enterica TaxID=28901 RepID=UPI003D2AFFFA